MTDHAKAYWIDWREIREDIKNGKVCFYYVQSFLFLTTNKTFCVCGMREGSTDASMKSREAAFLETLLYHRSIVQPVHQQSIAQAINQSRQNKASRLSVVRDSFSRSDEVCLWVTLMGKQPLPLPLRRAPAVLHGSSSGSQGVTWVSRPCGMQTSILKRPAVLRCTSYCNAGESEVAFPAPQCIRARLALEAQRWKQEMKQFGWICQNYLQENKLWARLFCRINPG